MSFTLPDLVMALAAGLALGFFACSYWHERKARITSRERIAIPGELASEDGAPDYMITDQPDFTYEKLLEKYKATPKRYRDEMVQGFVGTRVTWECTFYSAAPAEDSRVSVQLLVKGHRLAYVSFTVPANYYPGLLDLDEGHPVLIRGALATFDGLDTTLTVAVLDYTL